MHYITILGFQHSQLIKKYFGFFEEIGFKARDGKFPYFVSKKRSKHNKKVFTLTFASTIPRSEWEAEKERVETALDCSVRRVESDGKTKRKVQLIAVPSTFRFPTKIEWSDDFIDWKDGEIVVGHSDIDTIHFNLNESPHVLSAGETGSGKSVLLRCMLRQMAVKGAKIYMIDFKGGVEFGVEYEKYGEVYTEREPALEKSILFR
jgi:S-DNA-T family DNA segregation ATPase FtsK/SpoIIIE